jgi:hypothetical protein
MSERQQPQSFPLPGGGELLLFRPEPIVLGRNVDGVEITIEEADGPTGRPKR